MENKMIDFENRKQPLLVPDFEGSSTLEIEAKDFEALLNTANILLNHTKRIIQTAIKKEQLNTKYIDMLTGKDMTEEEVEREKEFFMETMKGLEELQNKQ